MFGNFQRNIDAKNRVLVPSKLRDSLGNTFYITLGIDKVLELRDSNSFEIWKMKLLEMNKFDEDAKLLIRYLLGNTMHIEIDNLGRFVIPELFLKKANITTKEIVFIGTGDKIEIWPSSQYNNFDNQFKDADSVKKLAQKLLDKGNKL